MQTRKCLSVLPFLAFLISEAVPMPGEAPLKVSLENGRSNLVSPMPVLRVPESERLSPFSGIKVRLFVGADGRVRSVQGEDSSNLASRALAIAKTLQYRPFLLNGVAVEAEVDEYVRVLPLETLPQTHVSFPKISDLRRQT